MQVFSGLPDVIQSEYANDPKKQMLAQLLQMGQGQASTPLQALGNVGLQFAALKGQKDLQGQYAEKAKGYNDVKSQVLAALVSGNPDEAAKIAATNNYTADQFGLPLAMESNKRRLASDERSLQIALEREEADRKRAIELQDYERRRKDDLTDYQKKREIEQKFGNTRDNSYYTTVKTPEGLMNYNHRTGQFEPLTLNGKPLRASSDDPTLQGDIAASEAAGRERGQFQGNLSNKAAGAPERAQLYNEAESLLKQGPTGSLVGNVADKAAAIVGKSTKGAELTDQLNIIGGKLTLSVPRMEGPQSNADTILYKQTAGDLANPNIPVNRRLKALETLRTLDKKYENLNNSSGFTYLGTE